MKVKVITNDKKIFRDKGMVDGIEVLIDWYEGYSPNQKNYHTVGMNGGLTVDEARILANALLEKIKEMEGD